MRRLVSEIWHHQQKQGNLLTAKEAEDRAMAAALAGFDNPQDALDEVFERNDMDVLCNTAEGFLVRVQDVRWAAKRKLDQ